jgi:hypothetical protein
VKNIEVLSTLMGLEDVTLRSITTPDLNYLQPLDKVWSLDVKLGGIRSFAGIEGKQSIKYLELWQIRELSSIEIVAQLPGLQNLFLQSLPRIKAVPSLRASRALRRVELMNMKGLRDFSELEWAPGLEEFALVEGSSQDPQQLLPVLRNPAVKRLNAGFGSRKKNDQFSVLRERHGKDPLTPFTPFDYL